jgi:hypothetical protein
MHIHLTLLNRAQNNPQKDKPNQSGKQMQPLCNLQSLNQSKALYNCMQTKQRDLKAMRSSLHHSMLQESHCAESTLAVNLAHACLEHDPSIRPGQQIRTTPQTHMHLTKHNAHVRSTKQASKQNQYASLCICSTNRRHDAQSDLFAITYMMQPIHLSIQNSPWLAVSFLGWWEARIVIGKGSTQASARACANRNIRFRQQNT